MLAANLLHPKYRGTLLNSVQKQRDLDFLYSELNIQERENLYIFNKIRMNFKIFLKIAKMPQSFGHGTASDYLNCLNLLLNYLLFQLQQRNLRGFFLSGNIFTMILKVI